MDPVTEGLYQAGFIAIADQGCYESKGLILQPSNAVANPLATITSELFE
tara:strand:- start:75 stop:221 length:147 start_codon:yes stop_codon:yes gene_type:complete